MIVVASAVSLTVPDVGSSSRFFTGALGFREELVLDGFVQLCRDDAAVDIELCAGAITAANVTVSSRSPICSPSTTASAGPLRGRALSSGTNRGVSARCG